MVALTRGWVEKIWKGGTLASYINTNYFTGNSLKIIGNFTEKGGAAHSAPPLNSPMISINDQLTT